MPQGWFHRLMDLCTLGKDFKQVHKEKDNAWRFLGVDHREIRHKETIDWIVGLFRKAGRESNLPTPERFYKELREILNLFSLKELFSGVWLKEMRSKRDMKNFLTKLPPGVNASIQHEVTDEIWSKKDYKTRVAIVEMALKTLFEGEPMWGRKELKPPENEETRQLRRLVRKILNKKGVKGLI